MYKFNKICKLSIQEKLQDSDQGNQGSTGYLGKFPGLWLERLNRKQ